MLNRRPHIIVHAWQWEDGHQSYADPGCDRVDGWCAYARTPITGQPDGAFEAVELGDTSSRDEAVNLARAAASARGISPSAICIED